METDPPYRTDLINAAMGARRLTNEAVAKMAGVGVPTVSRIRNGYTTIGYMTLKRVVEAVGLSMAEVAQPKQPEVSIPILNSEANGNTTTT